MNLKRKLIVLIIFSAAVFLFVTIKNNTRYLNPPPDPQTIRENNLNENIESPSDLKLVPTQITVNDEQHTLYLPEGFEISVFVEGLIAPRSFAFDDNDTMYITDKGSGKVLKADKSGNITEIDSGLRNVHGIDWYENKLYVAEEGTVITYENLDSQNIVKRVIIDDLPTDGGHVTRTVKISPNDGKLYLSVGSTCNVCVESNYKRAALLQYNLDGSDEVLFASGLRNTVGFTFHENKIWGVDNGRDRIGDDLPLEEINVIEQGKDYGWPYCHSNQVPNPEYPDRKEYCIEETELPTVGMQAHSAPLGITFIGNDFPLEQLRNMALVAFHGSWNRTVPTGYKVVSVDVSKEDPTVTNFVSGWLLEDGSSWGRPVDVIFDSSNNLYITDDKAGVIYKVEYVGT